MIYHDGLYFKTKFIRNETKDTITRVYSSFFFFSRCYHRGTFNVANVPFSTRNISVFEFNIVSLVLGIGNFFKSPEIFFFFFFCLMKILVFFFLHPRRFSLNNSFAMDIVGQMELESFFSLYVYFFR